MLHAGLARFFDAGTFSDITVVVPDGRRLRCHQVVLSAASKRFASMLEASARQVAAMLRRDAVDTVFLTPV